MVLPRILIFYIGQRDSTSFSSSSNIDFPLFLRTTNSDTSLEYRLTGRIFSTSRQGAHFTAKVIREFGHLSGVYHYDDLTSGKASLTSSDVSSLSGKESLTVMALYSLLSDDDTYTKYLEERAGKC